MLNCLYHNCYIILKKIVDEAMFIHQQTNMVSEDFSVCHCSMQNVVNKIKQGVETEANVGFVGLVFKAKGNKYLLKINVDIIINKIDLQKKI